MISDKEIEKVFKKLPKSFNKKKAVITKLMKTFSIDSAKISSIKTKNTMAYKKPNTAPGKGKTNARPTGKNQPSKTQNDRHYVGGGWDNSGEYGIFLNLQINMDKLNELTPDKYGNVKITIAQRKEADERSGMQLMAYHKND